MTAAFNKHILITLGDPKSITTECLGKLLFFNPNLKDRYTIIGSRKIFDFQMQKIFHKNCDLSSFIDIDAPNEWGEKEISELPEHVRGQVSVRSLEAARQMILKDPIKYSILTAPIDKSISANAGFKFPGQTEFFESLAQKTGTMCLAGPKLRVGLVTNHLPLKEVSAKISADLIVSKLENFATGLQKIFHIEQPRIAVLGLNPHTGDHGLFGREEIEIIEPAIKKFTSHKNHQVKVSGPVPADTAFFYAVNGQYDGVLAMYHDQGLGPLKTIHFDTAVNVTLGLDFLRVSPDHGPATDLFGQNKASTKSFEAALQLLKIS